MTQDGQTLDQIQTSMRDIDATFQRRAAPPHGSAARVEIPRSVDMHQPSFEDKVAEACTAEVAEAELLWVQKYARGDSTPPANRGGLPFTTCYCCGDKGHCARNCLQQSTAQCTFCGKPDHLEKNCRTKKAQDGTGGGPKAEVSFFMGEEAFHGGGGLAEEASCNMVSLVQFGEVFDGSSRGEASFFLGGEIEVANMQHKELDG